MSEDQSPLSLIEVFPAQGLYRHCSAIHLPVLGWIGALQNINQADFGGLPSFLNSQDTISPDGQTPAPAIGVAVLDQKGLDPAFLYPQAKPRQFVIPDEEVRPWRLGSTDNTFRDFDHLAVGKQRVSRRR
jgi:hypothetical protein